MELMIEVKMTSIRRRGRRRRRSRAALTESPPLHRKTFSVGESVGD